MKTSLGFGFIQDERGKKCLYGIIKVSDFFWKRESIFDAILLDLLTFCSFPVRDAVQLSLTFSI